MNNKASPLAIAHRGASGEYPENTMIAFTKAIEMGADVLEVDFMRTKDGYIIVMHDTVYFFFFLFQNDNNNNSKTYDY